MGFTRREEHKEFESESESEGGSAGFKTITKNSRYDMYIFICFASNLELGGNVTRHLNPNPNPNPTDGVCVCEHGRGTGRQAHSP